MTEPSHADLAEARAGVERYRDLAKYLIGVFASIGVLLVAGTQLSSLGKLSWEDDRARLVTAAIALAITVGTILWIVAAVLAVLRPVDLTLAGVRSDAKLTQVVEQRPELLGGADSVADVEAQTTGPLLSASERAGWEAVGRTVVDRAALAHTQRTFEAAWRPMAVGAVLGTAAIAVFAWSANPADEPAAEAIIDPAPAAVSIDLTNVGRQALDDALGSQCVERSVRALVIGGTREAPRVVTLGTPTCKAAQFVLSDAWGHASPTPSGD
jgi:hypothetical protein